MRNQAGAASSSLSLGLGNPKPLGEAAQRLFPRPGKVWRISDFIRKQCGLLDEAERDMLLDWEDDPATCAPSIATTQCLARGAEGEDGGESVLAVRRSGGRSAYSPELGIKWKGCRLVADGTTYPLEKLSFGEAEIAHSAIPFGTLTAEAAIRELVGYCFFRRHGLPSSATPVCVYEYGPGDGAPGYCLVLATPHEDRVEAWIDYPDCTIADVIEAKRSGRGILDGAPLGAELRLRGLNVWRWAERKSEILVTMHLAGGFRGILNSNIGNDVLVPTGGDTPDIALCDFDSFRVIDVPARPNDAWLRAFLLWCVVEVIKGSVSILDHVEIPPDADLTAVADRLGTVYFAKSSLWRAYERRLQQETSRRGWEREAMTWALRDAKRMLAVGQALSSCILNSYYQENMSKERRVFYPHN